MMNQDLLRQMIRRTVAHRAGGMQDARAIAGSTLNTCEQVAARLAPVIGPRGVEVLLGRALQLTSRSFPWLATAGQPGATPLETLRAGLASGDAGAAADAGCAVLETFMDLLSTLIGASLSDHLLLSVWEPASIDQEQAS